MLHHYEDIRSRIAEEPKWWDENGVPRYCDFSPQAVADIYARQAALVEIACQNCGQLFLVAMSQGMPFNPWTGKPVETLEEQVRRDGIHYGDPPNAGCCAAGPSMNCEDNRVVQFWRWRSAPLFDWERIPALEIPLGAAPTGDRT